MADRCKPRFYALYKGEKLISTGTIYQIAKDTGLKVKTLYYYSSPAYLKRYEGRKEYKCGHKLMVEITEEGSQ